MYVPKPPPPAASMPGGVFETKPKKLPLMSCRTPNAMQMLRGSREKRKLKVTPEKRMRKYDAECASEGIRGGVRPNRGSSKP
jgi:hypothetical protein